MEDISRIKCTYISRTEIWQAAEKFRHEYWPESTLPVDIEGIVEKCLGLSIEPKHNLLSEIDIDAYLKMDLTGIVVDHDCYMNEKFMNRLRFSFAHELGHFFLHKNIYSTYSINTSSDWKGLWQNIPDQEYGYFEYQANEFAGRVLVPRERLISELHACLRKIQKAGLFHLIATDPSAVLARISPSLCRPFGVSDQVIERRVEREELWPPKKGPWDRDRAGVRAP